jgi:hypothetical protein
MKYHARLRIGNMYNVSRRDFVGGTAAALAALTWAGFCQAGDPPPVSADIERVVKNGLDYLARQQIRESVFDAEGDTGVGVASRALLAFLAAGHIPDVGRHGFVVRGTIDWLLRRQNSQGWYGPSERGLRPHVSATTALSQAYGVESSDERRLNVHESLGKAVSAILSRQTAQKPPAEPGGGWGAGQSVGRGENLPLTALTLFALRACGGVGFPIPQPVTSRALDFTLRCFDTSTGGFGVAPAERADPRSTCAGVLCLFACDATAANPDRLNSATKFILPHAAGMAAASDSVGGIVPLAALKLGSDVWSAVAQPLMNRLVKAQQQDGSWPGAKPQGRPEVSRTAATASVLSVLTMSYPLLPIYQH